MTEQGGEKQRCVQKQCPSGPLADKPAFKGACGSLWLSGGAELAGLGDAGQAGRLGGRAQARISAPLLRPGACAAPSCAARRGGLPTGAREPLFSVPLPFPKCLVGHSWAGTMRLQLGV